LNIEVIEKEGLKRELKIEIPAETVDESFGRILQIFRQKTKIKGFRPGKTPLSVIRSRYKEEVKAEVVDELVKKFYQEAVQEKKLATVGQPLLTDIDIDEGKPMKMTLVVEVMPEIETVHYDGITIEEKPFEIADEEIDKVVDEMRKSGATLQAVDRAATAEDAIICDLEAAEGDTDIFEEKYFQSQEIDLDSPYTDPEFKKALTGANRDDMRDVTINYPENYQNPRFAGKTVTYRVTVNEIKEKILPTVDDEFAKQSGQGETVLEMRLNIRKQLEKEAETDQLKDKKRQLIDQIGEKNPVEVPTSMVDAYLENIIKDFKENNREIDEAEIKDKYRPAGEKTVRWFMLFHRLAKQENIEVSPEDTENWIKTFAANYHMEVAQAKQVLAQSGRASEIKDGILEERVIDFLMAKSGGNQDVKVSKEG